MREIAQIRGTVDHFQGVALFCFFPIWIKEKVMETKMIVIINYTVVLFLFFRMYNKTKEKTREFQWTPHLLDREKIKINYYFSFF